MTIIAIVVYDNAGKADAGNHRCALGAKRFASFGQRFSQPSVTRPEAKARIICLKAERTPTPLNQVFTFYLAFHLSGPCRRQIELSSPPEAVPMDIGSVGGVVPVFNRRPPITVPDGRDGLKNVLRFQQLFRNVFLECRRVAVSHVYVDDPISLLDRIAANPFSLLTHNCRLRPVR
jgi:hypothetical protein